MNTAVLPQSPVENWQCVRDEWVSEVNRMADDVEHWAKESDWDTKREMKEIVEDEIGAYEVPVVRVQTMQGRLYFEPVARFVGGADGRIEVTATSTFWQAILLKNDGRWWFADEEFEDLKQSWSREGFTAIGIYLLKKK